MALTLMKILIIVPPIIIETTTFMYHSHTLLLNGFIPSLSFQVMTATLMKAFIVTAVYHHFVISQAFCAKPRSAC